MGIDAAQGGRMWAWLAATDVSDGSDVGITSVAGSRHAAGAPGQGQSEAAGSSEPPPQERQHNAETRTENESYDAAQRDPAVIGLELALGLIDHGDQRRVSHRGQPD